MTFGCRPLRGKGTSNKFQMVLLKLSTLIKRRADKVQRGKKKTQKTDRVQRADDQRRENQRHKEFPSHCWKFTTLINSNDRWTHYRAEPAHIGPVGLTDWQIAVLNLWQIAAYESEISKLREELLKEIGHLEERKEEAVKAAANCSPEHFQNLQDQFFSELHQMIKLLKKKKKKILVSWTIKIPG